MRSLDVSRRSLASFGVTALFAITAAAAQVAGAPTGAPLDTSGNYSSELRACMQGKTAEDPPTCEKEARNAQADRKRGLMGDAGSGTYAANARARCNLLSGEDKAACDARMLGYGTVSGSVAGGGVLREVETVVMPPGQDSITVDSKTSDPVVIVPAQR
jgi:hypothetical protein